MIETLNQDPTPKSQGAEVVALPCPCSLPFEDVSIEELAARYARKHAVDQRNGYGAVTKEEHFQLALLYLATGRYELIEGECGNFYRIPDWSDFSEQAILALEADSSENDEMTSPRQTTTNTQKDEH